MWALGWEGCSALVLQDMVWSAGSNSLPECDLPERGFLELPSTGGKQLRNILSDPDPVLDWGVMCQFQAPVSFAIPNVVS